MQLIEMPLNRHGLFGDTTIRLVYELIASKNVKTGVVK